MAILSRAPVATGLSHYPIVLRTPKAGSDASGRRSSWRVARGLRVLMTTTSSRTPTTTAATIHPLVVDCPDVLARADVGEAVAEVAGRGW